MIVIQHTAPMAFQERFALLSVSREQQTKYLWQQAHAYHINGAQAARSC